MLSKMDVDSDSESVSDSDPFMDFVRIPDEEIRISRLFRADVVQERVSAMYEAQRYRNRNRQRMVQVPVINLNSDDEDDDQPVFISRQLDGVRTHFTQLFAEEHGLQDVTSLNEIGIVQDVKGDGHCLHRAFMLGLFDHAVSPLYLCGEGVEAEGASARYAHYLNLTENFMGSFRRRMREHLQQNQNFFVSNNDRVRDVAFADLSRCNMIDTYRGNRSNSGEVTDEFLNKLWNEDTDFNKPVGREFWNGNCVLIVLSHFWRQTVVQYSTSPDTERDCFMAYWCPKVYKLRIHCFGSRWVTPPKGAICLHHDGTHYQYISTIDRNPNLQSINEVIRLIYRYDGVLRLPLSWSHPSSDLHDNEEESESVPRDHPDPDQGSELESESESESKPSALFIQPDSKNDDRSEDEGEGEGEGKGEGEGEGEGEEEDKGGNKDPLPLADFSSIPHLPSFERRDSWNESSFVDGVLSTSETLPLQDQDDLFANDVESTQKQLLWNFLCSKEDYIIGSVKGFYEWLLSNDIDSMVNLKLAVSLHINFKQRMGEGDGANRLKVFTIDSFAEDVKAFSDEPRRKPSLQEQLESPPEAFHPPEAQLESPTESQLLPPPEEFCRTELQTQQRKSDYDTACNSPSYEALAPMTKNIFPTDTLSKVSSSPKISMHPMFSRNITYNDKKYNEYKSFDGDRAEYFFDVDQSDLIGKIHTSQENNILTSVVFTDSFKKFGPGKWFHDVLSNANIPNLGHVSLRSDKACTLLVPFQTQGRRGKRPSHNFYALWTGHCEGAMSRSLKVRKGPSYFGCTTAYTGGLEEDELLKFAQSQPRDKRTIRFKVIFSGRCLHDPRKEYGRLSGPARKRKMDEVSHSNKKPKEMTKHLLGKMCPTKISCNNASGEITSVKTMYNLRYEARREEKKRKGILPNVPNYENILSAAENTQKKDLEMRKANGDKCTLLPGIIRAFDMFPTFNIHLHGRNMLLVAARLASEKRLVVGVDATGNLLNVPKSSFDGKIQHTLMTMQATECVLTQDDAEEFGDKLFHPLVLGERISPLNKTDNFANWILQLRKDTMIATESYPGAGDGIDLIPSVVKSDCAMELTTGFLKGLRSSHHVSTGQLYNNVVQYILRRHEYLLLNAEDENNVTRVSKFAFNRILALSPCIFKHCKSHVWRAVNNYRKHKKDPPIEFRVHPTKFDQIFSLIANEMTTISSISKLIVRLSILVALFDTEYLQCPHFDVHSNQSSHHDSDLSENVAAKMDAIATEELKKLLIPTDEVMESCIQKELDTASRGNRVTFNGHLDAYPIIERLKQNINFGIPYLESVDSAAKKGKVKICLVYYCYSREADGSECVSPRRCGGFSVDVNLPHTSGTLRNPLYSPTAARYVLTEWLSRSALWSQHIINVAEKAMNARIFTSNQSLEGTFRSEKHEVSTVKQDFGDIPSTIHRRYDDYIESGRLFAVQIRKSEALVESRRRRKQNVTARQAHDQGSGDSEMVWKGVSRSKKGSIEKWNDMMHNALRIARENGYIEYKNNSRSSMFKVLSEHAVATDGSFMSMTTFNKWQAGQRSIPLESDWTKVIKSFYDKHVKK